MKICTITCHHAYNHGAMLQAYALQQYLKSLGHEVSVIDYRPQYMPGLQLDFDEVSPRFDYFGIRLLYRLLKKTERQYDQDRRYLMEDFFVEHISVTGQCYTTIEELVANPPICDLFIAGSDQIWNTTLKNGRDRAFYLDFGCPKRKISYAASFATPEIEQGYEDFVKTQLQNFDAISVREESGARILESLGYKGKVVVDPVFLLDRKHWEEFDKSETGDDYILTYDFNPKDKTISKLAKRLSRIYNCKIYSLMPYKSDYSDCSVYLSAPNRFVSLVKNAKCVISNSFHGTVFAMMFAKKFFVVDRIDGLNLRMHDLLSRYGLDDRLVALDVPEDRLREEIDYGPVYQKLSKDIFASQSFLKEQIELAR